MKILNNIIGLMAVFCVVGGANAAVRAGGVKQTTDTISPRVSVASPTTAAARRLPTMILPKNTSTSSSSSSSGSSLMTMTECVEAYTSCIKDPEVCGANFEECTTPELFYAKKPHCNSVLLQCGADGINALFGTSNTTYLTIDNVNVYPTAGSILGQFIAAGEINNRLDKSTCVKRYTSCLHRENVCGEDFELCTSYTEFKKQRIYCESTLARCQDDGKTELFGRTDTTLDPTADSRLGILISEGAGLASYNAVATCGKVADQCILAACNANPYKCIVNSSMDLVNATDQINDSQNSSSDNAPSTDVITASNVSRYLKSACLDTIGGNKYCHMTAHDGNTPTSAELIDQDIREDVYGDIYALRMNTTLRDKIQKLADALDTRTKDVCYETIKSCAMRSCGGGLGSACYQQVFTIRLQTSDGVVGVSEHNGWINQSPTSYEEIKYGCSAIVNTDPSCKYAAASAKSKAYTFGYDYTYSDDGAFAELFPMGYGTTARNTDPIGAVEKLTALLKSTYSPAAIEQMEKQCKNTVISCVRSMCGADYTGCYRNRTDVMTDTYDTASSNTGSTSGSGGSMSGRISSSTSGFDNSMNKVGGVLDFTVIRGLCVNAVTQSPACEEHLKIQIVKNKNSEQTASSWAGATNVRESWVGAVSGGYTANQVLNELTDQVQTGCTANEDKNDDGTYKCDPNVVMECYTVDENGCSYENPYYVGRNEYQMNMAATSLFREVLGNLELEAQAKYNQKLTKEQNMCKNANEGGIMGRKDVNGRTYMWAKLRSKRVPKNYAVNGLKSTEFEESSDLYGSFCRARITVQSDDPEIQRYIQERKNSKDWTTAYFAVGDVFTCGSWIPQSDLEAIAEQVAAKKLGKSVADAKEGKMSTGQKWATAAATLGSIGLGGVGGAYLADYLQDSDMLGGLTKKNKKTANQKARNISLAEECTSLARSYTSNISKGATAYSYALQVAGVADNITTNSDSLEAAISDLRGKCTNATTAVSEGCSSAVSSVAAQCRTVEKLEGQLEDDDDATGRSVTNIVGAGIGAAGLGIVGGLATGKNIKAANRKAFTEAEKEFMDNVGNHIYCFVGADEAGTYGDLIQLSID